MNVTDALAPAVAEIQAELDALIAQRDAAEDNVFILAAQVADLTAQLNAYRPGLGVYADDGWSGVDVSNSYYQPNQPGLGSGGVSHEQARMRRGTSPNISLASNGTQNLADIAANGGSAWLDTYVAALAKVATVDPTRPVYATLDQEFRVRTRRGLITGPSADPAVYGKALSIFYAKARAAAANIVPTYWMAGSDRTFEGAVGNALTVPAGAILFDPYAHAATDTLASICRDDLAWIRAQTWFVGQPVGLGEFGMPVKFGDDALAKFLTDVRGQLDVLGIDWAVLFNRAKDNDHQIAGRTDGQTFPMAVATFTASLDG